MVAASGTTLSYQWYAATLLIPAKQLDGETSSTLSLTNVSSADEGQYHVEVKNAGGNVTSSKATLVVLNTPPLANNDSYTMPEDVPLTIPAAGVLSNDTDVDGDALRALLESNVSNGSLSLNPDGSFTYVANTNYYGSDSFTYRVSDGLNRAVAILQQNDSGGNQIEVKNSEPGAQSFRHGSAGDSGYSVSKVSLRLSRKSSTPDRNLNFSIGTGVNSGPIAGSSFAITMASITNTSGGSSFQDYAIVYAAAVGPFTAGTTYYLNFDNAPNGRDVFVETSGNNAYANGAYYKGGGNTGEDMRFKVYGTTNSDIATVSLTVTPVNDPPIATSDTAKVGEDKIVTIPVLDNDNDPEGTPLTITDTSTTNGTAVISGANVVFAPSTNFNGTVVFSYTISDGTNSATANVTVTVNPVNDAPVANNDTYTTLEDVPLTVPPPAGILTNDVDVEGDVLTAVLVSDAIHGSLSLNKDGSFTYTPNTDYFGSDSFTYRAKDGLDTGNRATVTIILTPVDDPPIALNDSTNTLEDASVTIAVLANDNDPEGTPLTLTGTSTTNGTAVISGANVVFAPSTNFNGTVVFSYTISDGTNSATANVTVTVTPENDAPVANNDTYTTLEDVPLTVPAPAGILTNDEDVEGDVLIAVLVTNVSNGSLSLNTDGGFTYTPNTDYFGSDSFTYRVTDGPDTGNVATVTINLTPVNDPLKFTSQQMTANGSELQVSGPASSTYVISASTNLMDWTPIFTNYTDLGNMTFTDTSATNNPVRFYRVEAR